jgi:hypothetical protein
MERATLRCAARDGTPTEGRRTAKKKGRLRAPFQVKMGSSCIVPHVLIVLG